MLFGLIIVLIGVGIVWLGSLKEGESTNLFAFMGGGLIVAFGVFAMVLGAVGVI